MTIYVDLDTPAGTVSVGTAYVQRRRGVSSTVFRYDESYLRLRRAFPVEPNLPLVEGPQYSEGLPGVLQDCSPDRWGRALIAKERRAAALQADGRLPELSEVDYP